MDNLNTILSKKFKRKNFILLSAASIVAAFTIIKAPFRLLFSSKKEQSVSGNENSIKVNINSKAVSRNSKV